jgi:hypothetical protein
MNKSTTLTFISEHDKNADEAKNLMVEASESGYVEVIVIGKKIDGKLYISHSTVVDRLRLIGALEEMKNHLLNGYQ